MIERLATTKPNKLTRTGIAMLLGGSATFGVASCATTEGSSPKASVTATEHWDAKRVQTPDLAREAASLRADIVRAEQSEAARKAARVEAAIPTPYTGPLPTKTTSTTHSPISTPSPHTQSPPTNTPSPAELPAVAGQYWFGEMALLQGLGAEGKHNAMLLYTLASKGGLSTAEIGCLDNIGAHESGFQVHDPNPRSEADGIPQANPASKMASAGADWRDNPITQETWMIGYVEGRYGSACNAWDYWQNNRNY